MIEHQDWASPIEAKASREPEDLNNLQIIALCIIWTMLLLWSAGLL